MPFPSMFKINQSLHDLLRHKMSFIFYERPQPETDLKSFVIAYCHFDLQFKNFCWTINSTKFSFLREKIFLLLLLQANIPYNYSSWIGVIESFRKWLSSTKSKIVPFHSLRDLVKTCVDNASCIFRNGDQCKRIEDMNTFIKETQRHNYEESFVIEKFSLFEKRELSCICLK